MRFLDFQLLVRQCLDGIVLGDLEPVPDGAVVREQVVPLSVVAVAKRTLNGLAIVGAAEKLEDDPGHCLIVTELPAVVQRPTH